MLRTLCALWRDQNGVILSAELVLVLTITVLSMVVGLHAVSKAITMELNDLANAFGTVNQSYSYRGLEKWGHAWVEGSAFEDHRDDCDCTEIEQPQPDIKWDPSGGGPEAGHGH